MLKLVEWLSYSEGVCLYLVVRSINVSFYLFLFPHWLYGHLVTRGPAMLSARAEDSSKFLQVSRQDLTCARISVSTKNTSHQEAALPVVTFRFLAFKIQSSYNTLLERIQELSVSREGGVEEEEFDEKQEEME